MRLSSCRFLLLFLGLSLSSALTLKAQYDQLPQVGLKQFAQYQHSDVDSVDLSSGNVNLHIPLVNFPQKGGKLRLNFVVRYNEPQWGTVLSAVNVDGNGTQHALATWLSNISQGRPVGVDIVRDQGITETQTTTPRIAPGCCGNGDPVSYYSTVFGIRDRTGAEHDYGMFVGVSNAPSNGTTIALAPDGSGWLPDLTNGQLGSGQATAFRDGAGLRYTRILSGAPGNPPAWNISDAHGNTISTASDGWNDTLGRHIPGTWTGQGAGFNNAPSGYPPAENDPFPGVPSTDTSGCASGAVASRIWTVPSSSDSGGSQTYKFCYSQYTGTTNFTVTRVGPYAGTATQTNFSVILLSKIILPNQTSYAFQYDPQFLDLTRIDLPTGGVVTYQYSQIPWEGCSTSMPVKRVVTQRTRDDGTGQPISVWKYRWNQNGVCEPTPGTSPAVVVTMPDGNDEGHRTSIATGKLVTDVVSYSGLTSGDPLSPTGTQLRKVETSATYNDSVLFGSLPDVATTDQSGNPITIQGGTYRLQFPGPVEKSVATLYDPSSGAVQSSQETDFVHVASSGSVQWIDPNNYWYPQSGTCACLNYSEITSEKDYDFVQGSGSGPGTLLRQVTTSYRFQDSGGSAYATAGLTSLPSSSTVLDGSNAQQAQTKFAYDEATYSSGAIAGEPTTVQRLAGGTTWYSTHTKFNSSGVWAGIIDAKGTSTLATSYDCSGLAPSGITIASGTPVAETAAYTHDCNTGAIRSYTDANGKVTTYTYADSLNRIKSLTYPDGGGLQVTYTDGSNPSVTLQTATGGSQGPLLQTVRFDGLGRTKRIETTAPGGTLYQDTVYDAMGRVWKTSNPYRTTSDATYGNTINAYDALNRPSSTTFADGKYKQFSYSANTVTTTDELLHQWKSVSDGLGRLTDLYEPDGASSSPSIRTNYTYYALGNLKSVTQYGKTGESPRVRSFSYDSLSRLLTSTNPETGTICYGQWSSGNCINGYDENSNLRYKTDARGVTTNYVYDLLNRLTGKNSSGGNGVGGFNYTYTYDMVSPTVQNGIGRLLKTSNGSGEFEQYGYDSMGRMNSKSVYFPSASSTAATTSAIYDLAGDLTSLTYPDGRVVSQGFDAAGRLNSVGYASWNGTAMNQTYLNVPGAGYDPAGHLVNATMGNNVALAATYDNRERLHTLGYSSGSTSLWGKQYGYFANSNLQSTTDAIAATNRQFTYDSLNRLTSAQDFVSGSSGDGTASSSTVSCTTSSSSGSSTGASPLWTDPYDSNIFTDSETPNDGNWTLGNVVVATDAATAPDGTATAMTVTATPNSNGFLIADQAVKPVVVAGNSVTTSVWLKSLTGSPVSAILYILQADQNGFGVVSGKLISVTTSWQQFSLTGTSSPSVKVLYTQVSDSGNGATGQAFALWNLRLEDSGTADATKTNYLTFSQRFSTSTWHQSQTNSVSTISVTDNDGLAPDGTHTAATLTGTSSTNEGFIYNVVANATPFNGVPLSGSVWARSTAGGQNLSVFLIENGAPVGGQVVPLSTTWQRIQVSGTVQSAMDSLILQIGGNGTISNGQSVQVWGAQVEITSQAGPYIATGSSSASAGTNLTNLLPYSQQPSGSSWLPPYGGGVVSTSQPAPDGTQSAAMFTANANGAYVTDDVQNPSLYDGLQVTGTIYLQAPSGSGIATVAIAAENSSGRVYLSGLQTFQLNGTWQRIKLTGTLPTGLTRLFLQVGGGNNLITGQSVNFWGAQIEVAPTAGPYVRTSALPVIVGQELSNLLPNSQAMNGTTWGYFSAGASFNAAQAPDGSNTAAVVTANVSSQESGFIDSVMNPSLYDDEQMTASVFLRVPSGSQPLNLYIFNNGSIVAQQTVTVTTTWQRFKVTATNLNGLQSFWFQIGGGGSFTNGQVLQVWGPQMVVGSSSGTYDATGCTRTNPSTGQPATLTPNGLNQLFSYDSFGNLLQNGSFNATYTANNQLFGYAYDAAGNLLSDGMNVMNWDAESRLLNAAGASYFYDVEGNRIETQGVGVTDTFYFGGRPIARRTAGQWTDLIYGPTGLLAEVPGTQTGAPVYRVTDHLGTNVASLLASGQFVNPMDYDPFGRVFNGNTNDPYLFTGHERDSESGLDYFGARYYGSNVGRWMSPDWSATAEPVPYASLGDPQTLNLYGYVKNNPVSNVDPTGHSMGVFNILNATAIMAESIRDYQQQLAQDRQSAGGAAQQQNSTQKRESAAEAQAKANMQKYGGSQPADKGLSLSPVSGSCGGGNHNCQYALSGSGAGTLYVYEHQTSGVLGGQKVGNADYVTPAGGVKANVGIFYDDIGGSSLDTYRYFTVSPSSTYNPRNQSVVPIRESGGLVGFEHMYSTGGAVYINGSTNISPQN